MLIPITKIKALLDALLTLVRTDYQACVAAGTPTESWLYRVMYGSALGDFDFYTQAVELFTRTEGDARRIETRLGFDLGITKMPTIYVHQPAEPMRGVNTISYGLDDNEFYENADGTNVDKVFRSFGPTFEWVISSPNINEVVLIYEALHAALIASVDTFNELFTKFNFTGKEYVARNDTMPTPLYLRAIQLDVDYIKEVPRLPHRELVTLIEFELPTVYTTEPIGDSIL